MATRSSAPLTYFPPSKSLYGITNGLDNDLIERLASQATASPSRVIRGEFHVAVAPFPEGDDSGHIEYTCFDGKSIPGERSGGDLPELFQGESLHRLLDSKIGVHLAKPGEEVARFVPPEGYQPPLDIFGQTLQNTGPAVLLKPGPNVRLRRHAYLSSTLGYVSIRDRELTVVTPIWISADRMEAHFIHFDHTESEEPLTAEMIGAALKTLQIKHGVRDSAVDELVASPPSGKDAVSVLLAEGSQVKPSSPPRLETIFDSDWRKGPPARTARKGWTRRQGSLWRRRTRCWRKYVRAMMASRVPISWASFFLPPPKATSPSAPASTCAASGATTSAGSILPSRVLPSCTRTAFA